MTTKSWDTMEGVTYDDTHGSIRERELEEENRQLRAENERLKSTLEACNTVAADYKKVRDEYKAQLDAIRKCGDPECRLCEACSEGLP